MAAKRLVLSFLASTLFFASSLSATWSILIFDTRTREIAIGSATCLLRIDLRALTPVIVVGKGVAVAQAYDETTGANRVLLERELRLGTPPSRILHMLAQQDAGHQYRQYAILDASGQVATFTGANVLGWKGVISGQDGDLVYSIQGNLLTGRPVLEAAEQAITQTNGDLGRKLMAAMDAARSMGGDGRCSCNTSQPTSCGVPPASFTRSAYVGYMMVARLGDVDGACDRYGCARGTYYMNLNLPYGSGNGPDPVDVLQGQFDAFRLAMKLRPDHVQSTVDVGSGTMPADGQSQIVARVQLHNLEGSPLRTGGMSVAVTLDPSSTAAVMIGNVTDHGDGSYSVPLRAGTTAGRAGLRIVVDDGAGRPVLLSPLTTLNLHRDVLWATSDTMSGTAGGTVEFVYNPGGSRAMHGWILLASMSGSQPGTIVAPGLVLPLNVDPVFLATFRGAVTGHPSFIGIVPNGGRVSTSLTFPPGAFALAAGTDLTFAAAVWTPFSAISNPVGLRIVP